MMDMNLPIACGVTSYSPRNNQTCMEATELFWPGWVLYNYTAQLKAMAGDLCMHNGVREPYWKQFMERPACLCSQTTLSEGMPQYLCDYRRCPEGMHTAEDKFTCIPCL